MSKKVELGKTGIYIHPIGLGANKISPSDPATNTEYGGEVVMAGINEGMNFIDSAYLYGNGVSEEIIGKTLKENNKRNDVVIATKGAQKYVNGNIVIDNHPNFLRETIDYSLKRLQTDVIDLFYIHYPDKETPKYEAVGELQRLKEAGKIRAIGVSNFSLEQLKEANQDGYVDVVQDEYNLINRSAENYFFPYCLQHNISFVPYFPFASGLLAGKYNEETVLTDRQKSRAQFQGDVYLKHLERVNKLRTIAQPYEVDVPHIVLAFYLTKDAVDTVIPGARNRSQVIDNLKAADIILSPNDIAAIESIFA